MLPKVGNETIKVEISFLGYKTQINSNIKVEKSTLLDLGKIGLQSNQDLLEEVVVETNIALVRNKINRKVYNASEFSIARGGTGIDIIKNLPSISFNGIGEIRVRGTTGFVVLLNNKPVQSDVQSLLSQIPANSIKDIEIITAPSAQCDAEGKAKILNILTLKNTVEGDYIQINTV